MRTRTSLLTAAAVPACAVTVLALVPGTAAAKKACSAGVHPYGGAKIRTFCGPASVQITVGSKTFKLSGGDCERGKQYISVNVGSVTLGETSKKKPDYFGLDVGKVPYFGGTPAPKDGTYAGTALSVTSGGTTYAAGKSSVTLKGNRTKGTFTGTDYSGKAITGSFSCG